MRRTSNSEDSNLQTQLNSLKIIVAEMMEEIFNLRKEIKQSRNTIPVSTEVDTNHPPDNFKCDKCE